MDPKFLKIFQDTFNNPELEISEQTSAADIPEWDSFNHLNLIMTIEDDFSVNFTTEEIGKMARVGDLIDLVQKKAI